MSRRMCAPSTFTSGWWARSSNLASKLRAGRRGGFDPPSTAPRVVLFTDPDTLRENGGDGWWKTKRGILAVEEQGVAIVLWGNETRSEMELIQSDLKVHHPFISENGGGLFIRHNYFQDCPATARNAQNYHVIDCGRPYHLVAEALHEIARSVGVAIRGFSDMSIEDVAEECQLSLAQARLAKLREYDEPFCLRDWDPPAYSRLCNALRRHGIRCFTHERFHHATSVADKAQSLRLVTSLYQRAHGGAVLTIGLAKESSEICLLRAVDIPLVMLSGDSDPARFARRVPTAQFINVNGAVGWSEAVLQMIEDRRGHAR